MRRRAVVVLSAAAAAVVAGLAAAAVALPLLTSVQADALAAQLQRAYEVQGICYGWELIVDDRFTGIGTGVDVGSAPGGAGIALDRSACQRYAVVTGTITYTGSYEEAEDFATATVEARGVTINANDIGLGWGSALAGEEGEAAAYRAIAAMPSVAARRGEAPYVPVEAAVAGATPPPDDPLDVEAGSDVLRERAGLITLLGLGALGGLVWLGIELLRPRLERSFRGAFAAAPTSVGFVGPGGRAVPGGHPLTRIAPGDVVALGQRDWQVRGTLLFDEDGYRWAEHLLDDVTTKRWLSVDATRGFDLAIWEAVPLADVEGQPPAHELRVRGVPMRRVEGGRAHFRAFGTTGTAPAGIVEYADYRGPSGARAAAERYGTGGWELAVGVSLAPADVVVHSTANATTAAGSTTSSTTTTPGSTTP